jgi:putative flippase GtrA
MISIQAVRHNPNARQFVKFLLVGVMTTAINFAVFALLLANGVHYLPAATIAFVIATVNSYTFNRRWTFRAGAHRMSWLAKFTAVQLVGLSINLLVLAGLVEWFGLPELLAQLLANCCVVMTNFVGNKFWTFQK